ncbi:MAG: hypothetical protein WDN69_23600 [Aliidongia sp.]
MGMIGDLGLAHDPCRALERMRQTQQALHQRGRGSAILEVEHALPALVEQLAGFEPEIFIRVRRHPIRPPLAA